MEKELTTEEIKEMNKCIDNNCSFTPDDKRDFFGVRKAMQEYAKPLIDEVAELKADKEHYMKIIYKNRDEIATLRARIKELGGEYEDLRVLNVDLQEDLKIAESVNKRLKYTENDMGLLWQYIVDKTKQIVIGAEITNNLSFDEYINQLTQSNPNK